MQKAVRFMVKTHEVYQKQKRKGKDIPYLTHPFTAGLILAKAGAHEDVVIAGLLHDTMEDSLDHKKVTHEMLEERFGKPVADLVQSVSEPVKDAGWAERKQAALGHIAFFSHESVLVKSADVLSNTVELLDDYAADGEATFERFNAGKTQILERTQKVVAALLAAWPESPLAEDLRTLSQDVAKMAD